MLAEAILFLKTNKSYMDPSTVCEAIENRRNEQENKSISRSGEV